MILLRLSKIWENYDTGQIIWDLRELWCWSDYLRFERIMMLVRYCIQRYAESLEKWIWCCAHTSEWYLLRLFTTLRIRRDEKELILFNTLLSPSLLIHIDTHKHTLSPSQMCLQKVGMGEWKWGNCTRQIWINMRIVETHTPYLWRALEDKLVGRSTLDLWNLELVAHPVAYHINEAVWCKFRSVDPILILVY